jgi:hypothetical protein
MKACPKTELKTGPQIKLSFGIYLLSFDLALVKAIVMLNGIITNKST